MKDKNRKNEKIGWKIIAKVKNISAIAIYRKVAVGT